MLLLLSLCFVCLHPLEVTGLDKEQRLVAQGPAAPGGGSGLLGGLLDSLLGPKGVLGSLTGGGGSPPAGSSPSGSPPSGSPPSGSPPSGMPSAPGSIPGGASDMSLLNQGIQASIDNLGPILQYLFALLQSISTNSGIVFPPAGLGFPPAGFGFPPAGFGYPPVGIVSPPVGVAPSYTGSASAFNIAPSVLTKRILEDDSDVYDDSDAINVIKHNAYYSKVMEIKKPACEQLAACGGAHILKHLHEKMAGYSKPMQMAISIVRKAMWDRGLTDEIINKKAGDCYKFITECPEAAKILANN